MTVDQFRRDLNDLVNKAGEAMLNPEAVRDALKHETAMLSMAILIVNDAQSNKELSAQ